MSLDRTSDNTPQEYDPTTRYHWLEFENRRLKGSGDDFQQLFEDIMVRKLGEKFVRVRPYGNIGDLKCDGIFQTDSTFFQVYSPDELKQSELQKKINEDLDGAIQHWGGSLKKWMFVYNVKRGLPPDIPQILERKRQQYPNIEIDHLSNDGLWDIVRELSPQQRIEILGIPPNLDRTSEGVTETPDNLPYCGIAPEKFVGREQKIKELHQQIQAHGQVTVCAVMGMGGVGKTELALQYALTHKQNYPGGICWLKANEKDVGQQIVEFARSRLQLEIPDGLNSSPVAQVGFCWTKWRPGDVLVVLDNVDNYPEIKPYLPPQKSRFRVLITTRFKFDDLPCALTLELLTLDAALELLKQWVGVETLSAESDGASELCERLGRLPLALTLVGHYLKKRRISLAEMLKRLESKGLNHSSLEVHESDRTRTQTIERGVAAAFELSWEVLSESAQELGKSLSICSSAQTVWLLLSNVTPESEIEALEDARVELENLHLVQGTDQYQMHPLIREFFQKKLDSLEEGFWLLKKKVDDLVCQNKKVQDLLASAHKRFSSIDALLGTSEFQDYEVSEVISWIPVIRTLYFCYMVRFVHNIHLALHIEQCCNYISHRAALEFCQVSQFSIHGYELAINLEPSLGNTPTGRLDAFVSFPFASRLNEVLEPIKNPSCHFDSKILHSARSKGISLIPTWLATEIEAQISWWETNEYTVDVNFKEFMLAFKNALQEQAFNETDRTILRQYYNANNLFVCCLNDCSKVSQEFKEKIEEELLLPITEIEERNHAATESG